MQGKVQLSLRSLFPHNMNIADFVATRKELTLSEFKEKFPVASACTEQGGISRVFVYEDLYWIIQYKTGSYYLLIENNFYIDYSLEALEGILFAWAHE